MGENGLRVNAGKTKIMIWGTDLDHLQNSGEFHEPSVALEWAATASFARAASTGCTRNAVGSSAWQRTLITGVHGARELHAPLTEDHRGKSKLDLTSQRQLKVVSSFCYLKRHALRSRWLWTFNHNTCKKRPVRSSRSCYQFSLPATSLLRH